MLSIVKLLQMTADNWYFYRESFTRTNRRVMQLSMSRLNIFTDPVLIALAFIAASCTYEQLWEEQDRGNYVLVTNRGGTDIAYTPLSGVEIITDRGFAFKDLNRNGKLDRYEDWRLSPEERVSDLASRLSIQEIAGLMLYSGHQSVPARSSRFAANTFKGVSFEESGADPWELSDQQKNFLKYDNLRHILVTFVQSPEIAARWNNRVQGFVEGLGHGIPANNSSDPRHGTVASAEFDAGAGGDISMWPGALGLAATFDPEIVYEFGRIASTEYRALGLATALSPMADLATDPRWSRVRGTFGEDPVLVTEMTRAYIDGFQSTLTDISSGWGRESVNAMVKHWPGGGTGEGGRDAHYAFGKYAVYPGNNLEEQLKPFVEGAFRLEGGTGQASAVMPYYTISWQQDTVYGENVGNAYSRYIITDLLRKRYGYAGVVCTDWGVTRTATAVDQFGNAGWGVEDLSEAERHYKAIMAGVDQFGGNNDAGPVIEAYFMGVARLGEAKMRSRFEKSAKRLLLNMFRTGLFENPYVDPEETRRTVGNPEFMQAGYDAQLKSVVMLKNSGGVLPAGYEASVYIPERFIPSRMNWFGMTTPERHEHPVSLEIAGNYFRVTSDPDHAEYAFVFIESPDRGSGYSRDDFSGGGNGYIPMSLQYEPYTATYAREESIAGGDPLENFTNRSYRGKTVTVSNTTDLDLVRQTRDKMGDRPVVVVMNMSNPAVFSEIEPLADAIVVHFGVQDQALMDILSGKFSPRGLLPLQLPANMRTVEEQFEDVPHDMEVYCDSEGNCYGFAFGMDWNGPIADERTLRYSGK